jgi:hypothetical protein
VLARNSADQIEHVEFCRRMADEMSQVAEPLGVLQTKGSTGVTEGPVLAISAEDSLLSRMGSRSWSTATSRATPATPRLRCHMKFLWAVRAQFPGTATR